MELSRKMEECTMMSQLKANSPLMLRVRGALQVHEDVSKLAALEELNLLNNDISGLPPKLGLLGPKLRVLQLEGNPLRSIRRSIMERGTAAVLEYLQSRIPAHCSPGY